MAKQIYDYVNEPGARELIKLIEGNEIQDFTTGINLLRGTKDLPVGRDIRYSITSGIGLQLNICNDGWSDWMNPKYKDQATREFDPKYKITDNGFAYWYQYDNEDGCDIYSPAVDLSGASEFTFSYDTTSRNPNHYISITHLDKNNNKKENITINNKSDVSLVFEDLYKVKYEKYTVNVSRYAFPFTLTNVEDGDWLFLNIDGWQNNVPMGRFKLEVGHIEKPIWSSSPFDHPTVKEVQEMIPSDIEVDVQDFTTGINLLTGTKDIPVGRDVRYSVTAPSYSACVYNICNDGWSKYAYVKANETVDQSTLTFDKYEKLINNGFSYWNQGSDEDFCGIFSPAIEISGASEFTFSYDTHSNLTECYISVWHFNRENNFKEKVVIYGMSARYVVSENMYQIKHVKHGRDYLIDMSRYAFPFTLTNVEDGDWIYLYIDGYEIQEPMGMFKLEVGHIKKPIWSPSPFDTDGSGSISLDIATPQETLEFLGKS